MAKKKSKKGEDKLPEGLKCFKKLGGGSLRFKNRIIKAGQIFAINPDAVPDAFKDTLEEAVYREGVVIVETNVLLKPKEKEVEKAVDAFGIKKAKKDGEFVREGNKFLYDVISKVDSKVVSEKPLTKGKAKELADAMNS